MVRSTAAVTAVLGAAIALAIAFRRQASNEVATRIAEERHEQDGVSALRDRYTNAAEQLGDDSAAVRLAGVFAMAALADDWSMRSEAAESQTCIDVLCAYLRAPRKSDGREDHKADLQVRQSIVSTISMHLQPEALKSWRSCNFDFTDAVFDFDVVFRGAEFGGDFTWFGGVKFSGRVARFDDTKFYGRFASFRGATFDTERNSFCRAEFAGTTTLFGGASFSGESTFDGSRFSSDSTSLTLRHSMV